MSTRSGRKRENICERLLVVCEVVGKKPLGERHSNNLNNLANLLRRRRKRTAQRASNLVEKG
jgi:hypothetical protein